MINPPKLKRKLEVKKYHGYEIKDEFSWVHQKNILEVLKDKSKLNPSVILLISFGVKITF